MSEVFTFLASYGYFSGGTFGNLFAQWQSAGVFSYVLPFLLIFALIFVILSNVSLFKDNKGVNVVIALAVSLMSLQFNFVSLFFSEIFPRFGIALSIILVLVIIGGLFFDPNTTGFKLLFAIIGLVIAAIVIFKSLVYFGWYTGSGSMWYYLNPNTLIAVAVIAAIVIVIASTKPKKPLKIADLGTIPVFDNK